MEISVHQVHNVLRTYRNLLKEKLPQTDRLDGKESDPEQSNPSIHDSVSISRESIKRLEEAENKHLKTSPPPEK